MPVTGVTFTFQTGGRQASYECAHLGGCATRRRAPTRIYTARTRRRFPPLRERCLIIPFFLSSGVKQSQTLCPNASRHTSPPSCCGCAGVPSSAAADVHFCSLAPQSQRNEIRLLIHAFHTLTPGEVACQSGPASSQVQ